MKIAIIGVGLIGGSLALCFKGKPDLYVVGYSNRQQSVDKYLKRGVVDYATCSLQEAVEEAEFIFLCVPVGELDRYIHELSSLRLVPGCIITDVGSTKQTISAYANSIQMQDAYFIGGHPMAGGERSGVEAASSHLFENAFYVLTTDNFTPKPVYDRLALLLKYTKAQLIHVNAAMHDEIVGAVSHLPHIIAVALVNQISRYNESNELYELLAAGGFRDLTRIASSDPIVWRDILLNNKQVLLTLLADWNIHIANFIELLHDNNGEGIEAQFRSANQFRNQLPERRKGVLTSMYDLYVDIPDHPGIIGRITSELGNHAINLSNIQIIESREDIPGVLRLSFRNDIEMDKAAALLKNLNYSVQI